MTSSYTAEEVARHNHEKDLWLVMHGGVYDLTNFLKEHPGGEEVLLALAGQDGTKCFDDIGHTAEAVTLRETFKIGVLSATASSASSHNSPTGVQDTTIDDDNWEYESPAYQKSAWLSVVLATGIVIYSFVFYYIWYS